MAAQSNGASGQPLFDDGYASDLAVDLNLVSNYAGGVASAVSYPGTAKDWTGGSGWSSVVRKAASVATLTLGADPGANGFSVSSSNNLVGQLPSGIRPLINTVFTAAIYKAGSGWTGGYAHLQIFNDGTIKVNYTSTTIVNGDLLAGTCSFPII